MTARLTLLATAIVAAMGVCPAAFASEAVYQYTIEHARYGNIGTYANIVTAGNDGTSEVKTVVHVAVKILGITMYREDAQRTEHWQGDRLVSFDGVTETNGSKLELHGQAQGDNFVVTTPNGKIMAPAKVRPSNPWAQFVLLDSNVMFSTKTGRLFNVTVRGGDEEPATFDGKSFQLRRYEIDGTKREFVWFDRRGAVFAFRTEEDGANVDFVLSDAASAIPEEKRSER